MLNMTSKKSTLIGQTLCLSLFISGCESLLPAFSGIIDSEPDQVASLTRSRRVNDNPRKSSNKRKQVFDKNTKKEEPPSDQRQSVSTQEQDKSGLIQAFNPL